MILFIKNRIIGNNNSNSCADQCDISNGFYLSNSSDNATTCNICSEANCSICENNVCSQCASNIYL